VPPRDALVPDDDIVIRKAAHAVEAKVERVNVRAILEVESERPRERRWNAAGGCGQSGSIQPSLGIEHPEIACERM